MSERVAIVTGGTGALGRHIVTRLESEGYKIYIPTLTMDEFNEVFDRSSDDTEDIKIRKIFAFDCDATSYESVTEFLNKVVSQERGNVGYLVNTVGGIDTPSTVGELSNERIEKMLSLNFYTAFNFTSGILSTMSGNKFGRIVSVGALAGLQTSPGRFAYSMSKQALINLMETVSEEYKDSNISCSTIVPGIIDTPGNREWGTEDDVKRWVKPSQLAGIISSIFSDDWSISRGSIIKALGDY